MSIEGLNGPVIERRYAEAVAFAALYAAVAATTTTTTRPPARSVNPPQPVTRAEGCAYAALIRSSFGGAGEWAVSIAWRESRCQPGAKSPTGCWGLFQLCVPLHMGIFRHVCPQLSAQLGNSVALDPACNVAAAKHLYDGSGTAPWRL